MLHTLCLQRQEEVRNRQRNWPKRCDKKCSELRRQWVMMTGTILIAVSSRGLFVIGVSLSFECPKLMQNIAKGATFYLERFLMAQWLGQASQGHKMFCSWSTGRGFEPWLNLSPSKWMTIVFAAVCLHYLHWVTYVYLFKILSFGSLEWDNWTALLLKLCMFKPI